MTIEIVEPLGFWMALSATFGAAFMLVGIMVYERFVDRDKKHTAAEDIGMFETFTDRQGQYRWRFRDANKRILFASTEGYKDKRDMEQCLKRARECNKAPVTALD